MLRKQLSREFQKLHKELKKGTPAKKNLAARKAPAKKAVARKTVARRQARRTMRRAA
jgi:hypothetical protein|tara:strand:- start:310 stop:480 length:171 start_codon:yes stop_codon:yes gene_type:complete